MRLPLFLAAAAAVLLLGCDAPDGDPSAIRTPQSAIPTWAADAVFYQIFPERFANGDPANDPTRASLEHHNAAPENWAITPWTGDWYAQAEWEQAIDGGFYASVYSRRYGGDLQGVLDRLDYLAQLGVNTLYFNPLFWARSLHKYDGNTFHHIDPYFGPDPVGDFALMADETSDPATWHWTAADSLFLVLVREAHARDLRLVIDGVWNHTGRDFFAFEDLELNQADSPYKDWYIVDRFDDPETPADEFEYEGWWGVASLPVFADNADSTDLHPGPKQYIFDATARWMDPDGDGNPADGVDGWRLDVAAEVPIGFWADWNAHVRRLNPEAYTVSEVWEEASAFLSAGGFSATMNYFGFAFPVKGFLIDGTLPPSGFAEQLAERREAFDPARRYAVQNLIDGHDTDRVASMIANRDTHEDYVKPEWYDYDRGERASPRGDMLYDVGAPDAIDREIQRLVALFQMTYVGAPMVYYGTEAGMWGADDPDDRMPMVWPEMTFADQSADPLGRPRTPDPVAFDAEIHDYYRRVIGLRRAHPSLRRGDFRVLATDDAAQTLSFLRTHEDEVLVVLLNRGDERAVVKLPMADLPLGAGQGLAPIFATKGRTADYLATPMGETLDLAVPPRTGVVLHRTGGGVAPAGSCVFSFVL